MNVGISTTNTSLSGTAAPRQTRSLCTVSDSAGFPFDRYFFSGFSPTMEYDGFPRDTRRLRSRSLKRTEQSALCFLSSVERESACRQHVGSTIRDLYCEAFRKFESGPTPRFRVGGFLDSRFISETNRDVFRRIPAQRRGCLENRRCSKEDPRETTGTAGKRRGAECIAAEDANM